MEGREKEKKERAIGVIGTAIFHGVIILLLLFLGLSSIPQEEEGILINFGDSPTGLGPSEPVRNEPTGQKNTPPVTSTPTPSSTPPPSNPKPAPEKLTTQNYEEAAAIKAAEKASKEAKKKQIEEDRKKQTEIDRQKRVEEEARKAVEAEKQRVLAEEKRKQEEMERQAQAARNNVKGAFSKTTGTGSSEGDTQGNGNQGALTGDPNATSRTGTGLGTSGVSFSLSGRSGTGSWPKPVENCNEEGVVVVEITVDKTGKVTAAQAILRGSRNLTACLRKAAEEAAKKARFNSDPNAAAYQTGTITYSFGFK
jgi:TonB family protein